MVEEFVMLWHISVMTYFFGHLLDHQQTITYNEDGASCKGGYAARTDTGSSSDLRLRKQELD